MSFSEKCFKVFNYIFLALFSLLAVYPLIYVLSASLSNPNDVILGKVWLWPVNLNLESYKIVMANPSVISGYLNAIYYMVVGTAVNLFVTICGAYPLSKKRLVGGKVLNYLVAFSMWFSAGMIAVYINFKELGLLNTRTAIIAGFACNAYNFMLLRNFFSSIPESLLEAAKIDGAHELCILIKIVLPLSLSSIATIGLFYAVARWNGYLWAMTLLQDDSKIPLQVVLKKLIVDMSARASEYSDSGLTDISSETVTYATIIVSVIPMVVIYPFIQKYFVKGVMIGAVKE